MSIFYYLLLSTFFFISSVAAQEQTFSKEQKNNIEDFITKISGTYNNQAQADTTTNPLLYLSEVRIFRIWPHKKNEFWFSMGWYQPNVPTQPIGEKIFHIKAVEQDKYLLDCYSWQDPTDKNLLLQWRKKCPYKKQTQEALVNDGCTNHLIRDSAGNYELKTLEGEVCAFNSPVAPFDGIFFHFLFNKKGTQINVHDINYKKGKVLPDYDYIKSPMLMRKISK